MIDKKNKIMASKNPFFNQRKEPRQPYTARIFFAYKKHLYEGKLRNYSSSGLFIQADSFFREGEKITMALPPSHYKNDMRIGLIVWKNAEGCGVKLCDET